MKLQILGEKEGNLIRKEKKKEDWFFQGAGMWGCPMEQEKES